MSKPTAEAIANLRRRVEQAQRESRWKDAIDLGRNLYVNAPTDDNRTLLRNVALGFARAMGDKKRTRDLQQELPKLLKLFPDDKSWSAALGEIAIGAGLLAEGARLFQGGDPATLAKLHATLADSAVRQGNAGRAGLPVELQGDHLKILLAASLIEQGKDDPAREQLQGIGLRSPFAEWRLFFRGLMAYYASDDARAIEAWSKLAGDRLPFRLAAPLRQVIDPAFARAQTPETLGGLQLQFRKITDRGRLVQAIEGLQKAISRRHDCSREWAKLTEVKHELDALPESLRERLARSIYWSLLPAPEDEHRRYLKVFTPPREDPRLHRLQAISSEGQGSNLTALDRWLAYEKEVAADRKLWGDDSDRVRALIWMHAGLVASLPEEEEEDYSFGPFRFMRPVPQAKRKPPVKPEDCYKRARELGPDLVAAYILPIQSLLDAEKYDAAKPLADDLRQRFPNDIDAQMTAGMAYSYLGDIPQALVCADAAARINPLDARVKGVRFNYAMALVMFHLQDRKFDDARAAATRAQSMAGTPDDRKALALMEASISWKSGDPGPIEKLRAELEKTTPLVAVLYMLIVQANVASIERKARAAIDKEFKATLDGELELPAALALGAQIATQGTFSDAPYRGFKTHREKIIKKLAAFATGRKRLTVYEALRLGRVLYDLKAKRPLSQVAQHAMRHHLPRPVQTYLHFLNDHRHNRHTYFGGPPTHWLRETENWLAQVPEQRDRDWLKAELEAWKEELGVADFGTPMDFLFGGPNDEDDYDDDEDDEDDYT